MKRIHLSKPEKRLLQGISTFGFEAYVKSNPRGPYRTPLRLLEGKDLVNVVRAEDGEVVDARVSGFGMDYISDNPTLRNPVNWQAIGMWVGIALSAAATAAALFACARAGLL